MTSPARPPTTDPLMRMICRSRPNSSSTRVEVSVASQRCTVVSTNPATSAPYRSARVVTISTAARSTRALSSGSLASAWARARAPTVSRARSAESGSAVWATMLSCRSDQISTAHSLSAGWVRRSSLSWLARAAISGDSRSRTERSRILVSTWSRTSWSGSLRTSVMNELTPA